MKIAPTPDEHNVLIKILVFLFVLLVAIPAYSIELNCEDDFEKPTIKFPDLPDVASRDTMYFDCAENILGIAQARALVSDNCDPDPLVEFGEFCLETGDCSKGYRYLVECKWTVVDNNNNATEFIIYVAIEDQTPPTITLDWGDGILSGDTLFMECGFAEPFDESYVKVRDDCDLSVFCEIENPIRDLVFEEQIVGQGDCDEYVTEMSCSWIATDRCGNTSVFEIIVFVTDNTPPEFTSLPADFCGSSSLTETQFQAYKNDPAGIETYDACTDVVLEYTIDTLNEGCDYLFQWKATDGCGNSSYHEQHICISNTVCVGQISGTVQIDNDKDALGDEPIYDVTLFLVEDVNRNGLVDGGETVYLTTTTDENGFYRFTDVPQGCYVIVELQPNGLDDVSDEDVTNPGDLDMDGIDDPVDNLIPVCVSAGEFDDGNDFVEQQFVLEVMLTSFEVTYDERLNATNLEWKTEYELNADFFTLERSVDGSIFSDIATIDSKSIDNAGASYAYIDHSIPLVPIIYYRLKDIDFNGAINYSDILAVGINGTDKELLVYPNPSNGLLNIYFPNTTEDKPARLELYDIAGSLVFTNNYDGASATLDLTSFRKGTYLLKVKSGSSTIIKRIVYAD